MFDKQPTLQSHWDWSARIAWTNLRGRTVVVNLVQSIPFTPTTPPARCARAKRVAPKSLCCHLPLVVLMDGTKSMMVIWLLQDIIIPAQSTFVWIGRPRLFRAQVLVRLFLTFSKLKSLLFLEMVCLRHMKLAKNWHAQFVPCKWQTRRSCHNDDKLYEHKHVSH